MLKISEPLKTLKSIYRIGTRKIIKIPKEQVIGRTHKFINKVKFIVRERWEIWLTRQEAKPYINP